MALSYMLLPDNYAVFEAIQTDYKAIMDQTVADPDSPVAAAYLGEPQAYAGVYPALMLYKVTARGQSTLSDAAENMLAQEYLVTFLSVYPASASPPGDTRTGRAYADDITMQSMAAFQRRLAADIDFPSRCTNHEMRALFGATFNEQGQAMFWDSAENDLWAQALQMAVVL